MATVPHPGPARRRACLAVAALVVVAGLAAGCSWTENDTKASTYGLPNLTQSLMAEDWRLDAAASSIERVGDVEVTLVFDQDTLSGMGPCNNYFGEYTVGDSSIEVGSLGATLRPCADPQLDDAEAAYLAALQGTLDVDDTDRDRLVLTRDGVHLEYTAVG